MKKLTISIIIGILLISSLVIAVGLGLLDREVEFSKEDKAILNEKGINSPSTTRIDLDDDYAKFCLYEKGGINDCSNPIRKFYENCTEWEEQLINLNETIMVCSKTEIFYYSDSEVDKLGESWEDERLADIISTHKQRQEPEPVPSKSGVITIK